MASWTDRRTWTPAGTSAGRSHTPSPRSRRCVPPGRRNPRSSGQRRAGRWPRPRAEERTCLSNTPSKIIRSAVPSAVLTAVLTGVSAHRSCPQVAEACLWTKLWMAGRKISGQVFLPHSRWIMFSLLSGARFWLEPLFPQVYPQGAHNVVGVSAHVIHSAVHRTGWYRPPRAAKMSEPPVRTVLADSGSWPEQCFSRAVCSRRGYPDGGRWVG
jgi:hypothetical protein